MSAHDDPRLAAPLTFFDWVDAAHPEWWAEAHALGGLAYHAEMMAALAAWEAAVDGCYRLLHDAPLRDLVHRVEAMYTPAPMG